MDHFNRFREAADCFYRMSDDYIARDTWYDFLLWCAYAVGYRPDIQCQQRILERYPIGHDKLFAKLYYLIICEVNENPSQNVLLRLMDQVHLSGGYEYDEASAERLFLTGAASSSVQMVTCESFPSQSILLTDTLNICDFDKYLTLQRLGNISLVDNECSRTGGSGLIAAANVYCRYSPASNRILLAANDPHDKTFALMSFIQLAIEGMACYTLIDEEYIISPIPHMELFAPPSAICSAAFFSDTWNTTRFQAISRQSLGF